MSRASLHAFYLAAATTNVAVAQTTARPAVGGVKSSPDAMIF